MCIHSHLTLGAVCGLFKSRTMPIIYNKAGSGCKQCCLHIPQMYEKRKSERTGVCQFTPVPPSSLRPAAALICPAPDPLLFCHSDMFNKYCRRSPGRPEVLLSVHTGSDGLGAVMAFLSRGRPAALWTEHTGGHVINNTLTLCL